MDLFANPYRPPTLPSFLTLRDRGHTVEEANEIRRRVMEDIQEFHRYMRNKPAGTLAQRDAEHAILEELCNPVVGSFDPDQVPAGITQRMHFGSLLGLCSNTISFINRETGHYPTKALVCPRGAAILGATQTVARSNQGPWRSSIGRFFGVVDVHVEHPCRPPYLLPNGQIWFLMAWRYDFPFEQRSEWAQPVAVMHLRGYEDNPMVHLAKVSRKT